jgi:hypothetical protein
LTEHETSSSEISLVSLDYKGIQPGMAARPI